MTEIIGDSCKFYIKTENLSIDLCSLIWRDRSCTCLGNQLQCDYRFTLHEMKEEENKP